MNDLDFDYLNEIGHQLPSSGSVRWGISFDGQRLAIVGYAICQTGRTVGTKGREGHFEAELGPRIFYAGQVSGVSMTRAVLLFDRIASATGLMGLSLVMEGVNGSHDVFFRHLRKNSGHGVVQFKADQGKYFENSDVLMAVLDDQSTGLINLAPEFEGRPERVLLDEEMGAVDLDRKLTPLQGAFLFGLGWWSCKQKRQRWQVGAGPAFW